MIHMPMQPESMAAQAQEVLDLEDTKAQFLATLSAAFRACLKRRGLTPSRQPDDRTGAADGMVNGCA